MISGPLISSLLFLGILSFINYIPTTTTKATFGFSNETDRQALIDIKDQVSSDPFNALSSWNNSLHFCSWQGVTCSRKHQRVTALNLSSLQLAGSLSPHIGNLTFLWLIDVGGNNFRDTIPQQVGRLFRLRNLSLENNSFQGEIPSNLSHCSNLTYLNLNANNLEGKIPSVLGSLSKMLRLNLARNHFTGSIPASFGNLSSLERTSLALNNLEGHIPAELGRLSALELLNLYSNKLSGVVPEQLYNMSSIYAVTFADNQLSGRLPPDIGLTLPNLQLLYLGINQFFGHIPTSIVNSSGLTEIDLPYNSLTGPVPRNLGNLQNLQYINLGSNPLGDENTSDLTFLTSLTNCTNLREVWFFENRLRGVLPTSISNLSSTNLHSLTLQSNYITGVIPSEIESLINLEYLSLFENMLTGRLPDSIGKLSKLKELHIYQNKISGNIPSSFGNLTQLLRLGLAANFLDGGIPVSLANCIQLNEMELSNNYLSGEIPKKLVGVPSLFSIFISSNNLSGSLPSQLGNLVKLNALDISENKISGEIPSSIENCVMLGNLNMEGNFLEGTVPSFFKKLRSLRVLDLSRNNLTGQIPDFLADLPLLGNLNLSFNKFEGEVPTEGLFANASKFSVAGNNNLCGGLKVLHLPECPKKRQDKRFPWRAVVITVSSLALFIFSLLASLGAIIHRKRSNRSRPAFASPLEKKHPKVSYAELVKATEGFSSANLIGDGRYGTIYKGKLGSDGQVAVKVLKLQQRGANKTFVAECNALRNIRHRNLVSIVTACSTIDFKGNDFKALIFEFMPNGNLDSRLHSSSTMESVDLKTLSLLQRINIATDVGVALDYLHNYCETPVIHCDLKPSNILLDNELTAHVGDFGLARILLAASGESISTESSSICIRGTVGYVAPEYGMGGEISTRGDVYSYGVLLLEMFTGKRPTDSMFTEDLNLHNFVKTALPDRVMEIVDPLLLIDLQEEVQSRRTGPRDRGGTNSEKAEEFLASILQVGVRCSADLPSERMVIGDALSELHSIRKLVCNN